MSALIFVGCFIAAAVAAPAHIEEKIIPAPFELKHHSDVDGTYHFQYASEDSSKTETRDINGGVRGAYSYIDDAGVLQKIQYIADTNGFQVYGTNLPVGSTVPVKETPEVLEATAEHFAHIDKHLKKIALAEKLEAEYKALHPELLEEHKEVHVVHVPVVHEIVVPHMEVYHHDEIPVAPEDDDEVKIARAQHLAIVEKLTQEHFAALAAAPKLEEEH